VCLEEREEKKITRIQRWIVLFFRRNKVDFSGTDGGSSDSPPNRDQSGTTRGWRARGGEEAARRRCDLVAAQAPRRTIQ